MRQATWKVTDTVLLCLRCKNVIAQYRSIFRFPKLNAGYINGRPDVKLVAFLSRHVCNPLTASIILLFLFLCMHESTNTLDEFEWELKLGSSKRIHGTVSLFIVV